MWAPAYNLDSHPQICYLYNITVTLANKSHVMSFPPVSLQFLLLAYPRFVLQLTCLIRIPFPQVAVNWVLEQSSVEMLLESATSWTVIDSLWSCQRMTSFPLDIIQSPKS